MLHIETCGDGSPVVLTHGLGDDASTWDGVVDAIAAEHRLARWDLRGHGRSDPADRYDVEVAIDDLLGIVAGFGTPVALVGHSLGGYLSLALAERRPELVSHLVLVSSGPGFRSADARARYNAYVDEAATTMAIPPEARGLGYQRDGRVLDELGSLGAPLLQVIGSRDHRHLDGARYLERKVPGSLLVVIDGAGHHPQRSHAGLVATLVLEHLR